MKHLVRGKIRGNPNLSNLLSLALVQMINVTGSQCFRILPESPRWLMTVGRDEEALIILKQAAKCNKLDTSGIAQRVESASICRVIPITFHLSASNSTHLLTIDLNLILCELIFRSL